MWKYQKYHRVNWELVHFGEAKVHSFGELLANGRILCRIPCGTKINIHQHPPKPKALPAAVDTLILCQENAYDIYRMYRYIFSPYIEEAGAAVLKHHRTPQRMRHGFAPASGEKWEHSLEEVRGSSPSLNVLLQSSVWFVHFSEKHIISFCEPRRSELVKW